jgi:hypothetical protein
VVSDAGRGGLYAARAGDAAHPIRVALAALDVAGVAVLSSDAIAIDGLMQVDPALALACAVPLALSRPALDPAGLSAFYIS